VLNKTKTSIHKLYITWYIHGRGKNREEVPICCHEHRQYIAATLFFDLQSKYPINPMQARQA